MNSENGLERTLTIRLSKSQKKYVKEKADKRHMTMSDYVRSVIEEPPQVTRSEFEASIIKMIYEVNKIGVNINQIARKYNQGDYRKPSQELLRELARVDDKVNSMTAFVMQRGG